MSDAIALIKITIGIYELLRRNFIGITPDEIIECALWLHMRRSLRAKEAQCSATIK